VRATPKNLLEAETRQPSRRLRAVRLLPAAATLGNLLCGFAALFCCLLSMRAEYAGAGFAVQPRVFFTRLEAVFPTHIATGAYLVLLAMIFDALDGRLARMTRRTSEFGAQLDSLSDVVSFGVAPAALFITLMMRPALGGDVTAPDVPRLEFRIGMVAALVYISCAAIRLARYNAENVQSAGGQRAFSGLPSPGAAAAVVSLLALHEHLRELDAHWLGVSLTDVLRWLIVLVAFSTGLLMVSRLDYVHVINVYIRRRRPPTHLVWLVVILGLAWYSFELLFVVLALGYALSGVLAAMFRRRSTSAVILDGNGHGGARSD
jgi:CDP-diacylglycerol--serine O-phosphatidyltransferase